MKLILISKQVGLGAITKGLVIDESLYFDKQDIEIGSRIIKVDEKTTLEGKFEEPLRYVGTVRNQCGKVLAFHLGSTEINGVEEQYYSCIVYESKTRILNITEGQYQKYILKENRWIELYS